MDDQPPNPSPPPPAELVEALSAAAPGLVLVVTGAGVSLASGIPTFRGKDPGAIWSVDVTELGTVRYFRKDPVGSWRWYLSRFNKLRSAAPNPAHTALATLERWHEGRGGEFLLVTQNIDSLHERGGSRSLVKVHGSADRLRCSRPGCALGEPEGSLPADEADFTRFVGEPSVEHLPRCRACGALLRPHVLWFDEYYQAHRDYQFDRVLAAIERAAVVLFAGTSFAVGITDAILSRSLGRGVPVYSIDPATRAPDPRVCALQAPAEELLPALVAALG